MKRPGGRPGALLALLVLVACGGPSDTGTGPPDLRHGERLCARCGMSVDDPRFAGAIRAAGGRTGDVLLVYDDLGEIFLDTAEQQGIEPLEIWVHDAPTERWIEGRGAHYVRGRIESPMGLGLEAYADGAAAARRAEQVGGEVLSFDALMELAHRGELEANATREEAR